MAPNLSTLRPLIAGDVIIDAKPVVYVVSSGMKGSNCDNCLALWDQLKKCSKCLKMFYCDRECQQNDWKYHKNECKVYRHKKFKLRNSSVEERLLIRLLFAMKSDDTLATKRYQLSDGSDFSLNDIKIDLKQMSSNPFHLSRLNEIFKHFEAYNFSVDKDQELNLLRWFGIISCSPIVVHMTSFHQKMAVPAHVALQSGMDPIDFQSLSRYEPTPDAGRGIFPQFWSVGHSCLPNACVIPNGLSIQLKALGPISAGTQITRSYVDLAQNKIDRNFDLIVGYLHEGCDCLKCNQNLDSDIDYEKYMHLALHLREYKSEIELEVQQMGHKPKRYGLSKYMPLFKELKDLEKRIFGEFTMAYTETLLMARLVARFCNESCGLPWDNAIEQELEDNFRVAFGPNHPTYEKYSRHNTATELAKAGRQWRDGIRKEKNWI